jgi:hypothetical protein
MKIQKYKMTNQTYKEYLASGILLNMGEAKWGKNRSAIILGKAVARNGKTKFTVEVEVLGYFVQPI